MSRTIKTILLVLIAAMAAYVAYSKLKPPGNDSSIPSSVEVMDPVPGRLDGLGIRYDGYYQADRGSILYLIRFFGAGNAVLINGTKEMEKELPAFLIPTTKGNPAMGLYNIQVNAQDDSLHFDTHPEKGVISYRGKVMSASVVHFHRLSHINGKEFDMDYVFHADSTVLSPQ
ncbi:MAG: hypothetical protein IPI81_17015 [Flavobacteriales bacterium]|nr:hypothetical protein [Flavobacteriales bacterium]MCC6938754.1 hypothetical protein [Flavobacteriales bacterium]